METEQTIVNNEIMDYLGTAEGTYIHFNRTEKDITSAFGIYRYAHPTAEIFKWYESVAEANGLTGDLRKDYKELNKFIARKPELLARQKLLAWMFYVDNFMNPIINSLVSDKIEKTFFSLAVNGGMKRAYKAMQSALSKLQTPIVVDGKFGHNSMEALINYLKNPKYDEADFNDAMLAHMSNFYAYLIENNPNKYARYENGWNNRLKALT